MALTRITKGVIKPNENYDTHNINSTGIITAVGANFTGNVSVGGVLTYEDVSSIDAVGIITANQGIHVGAGVSAVGVGTFGSLDIGGDIDVDGHTNLDNVSISGVTTASDNIIIPDNKKLILGTQSGRQLEIFHNTSGSSNHRIQSTSSTNFLNIIAPVIAPSADTFVFKNNAGNKNVLRISADTSTKLYYNGNEKLTTENTGINITGIVTATSADINGDLDVDGHTNLDNVSVAGVTTFAGAITAPDIITAGALLHEGDTDTLVHFSAADTIQLKTHGNSRLLINNAGVNLENGYFNSNGNRIILGDSSGATDDRLVLGNTNDLQLYHNASDSYIENATGVLKILGDDIQLGEGNDTVGIGTDNAGAKLDVFGNLQVKDSAGLQNFYISDSGFKYNQTVSNWSNMTYTSSPVLGWDYKNGPGDMFYVGSGGNTAMASQMALVVSDGHGVKIGKSGYDGTDYDISSSDEFLRITTTGQIGIGTAIIRNSRAMQFTGASNSLFLITGHAPSICLNRDPDDSSDSDRSFFGVSSVSNGFANGTAAGDTVIRGNSSGKIHLATSTSIRMSIASGGDTTFNGNVSIGGDLTILDKIIHNGDTNTAIRFPTTDNISFETGGSERFRIGNDGKVLIGDGTTYSPQGLLHIVGDDNSNGPELYLQVNNNNTTDNIGALLFGNNVDKSIVKIQGVTHTANNTGNLTFHTSTTGTMTEKLRITSDGRIKLSNSDGIQLSAQASDLYATDGALSYYATTNGVYLNGAGANGWLRLNAAGSANDRTSINLNGHSASGGDSIHFRTNSSERLRIMADGNLMMGNAANPGNTLRYFDVYNTNTGTSAGAIVRLLTTKSDGTSIVGLDIVKYKSGGAYIINNENVGADTGFIAFNTGSSGVSPATHMRISGNGEVVISPRNGGASNNRTSIHFNNAAHTPFIAFKSNNLTEAAYIQVPESNGGAEFNIRTKNTSGTLLSRLTLKNNGEIVTHQLAGNEKGYPLVMGTGTVANNTQMSGSFNYHDFMCASTAGGNNYQIGGWVYLGHDYGSNPYPVRRFQIAKPGGFSNGTIVYQVWHNGDSNYLHGGLWEIRINCWTGSSRFESVAIRCVNGSRDDLRVIAYNDTKGIMIQTSSIWGQVFIRKAGWDDGGRNPGSSYCAVANNGPLAIYNSQGTDDGAMPSGGVDLYPFDGTSGSASATHTGGYYIENGSYFDG